MIGYDTIRLLLKFSTGTATTNTRVLCQELSYATTVGFLHSSTPSSMVLVSCLQKKKKGQKIVSCKCEGKKKSPSNKTGFVG